MGRPSTKCSYLFDLHFLSTGQVALTQSLSRISWILLLQCTFRASTQLGPHSSSFHRTATQDSPWGTYHTEISMPSASLYWSHKPMTISLFHITDQRLSDIFLFWLPLHLSFGTNHALALYLIAVAVLIYCHHIRLHDLANTITLYLSFSLSQQQPFRIVSFHSSHLSLTLYIVIVSSTHILSSPEELLWIHRISSRTHTLLLSLALPAQHYLVSSSTLALSFASSHIYDSCISPMCRLVSIQSVE
nr:hypothetical protein Q903MT_gene167 [Picea sitchensis]